MIFHEKSEKNGLELVMTREQSSRVVCITDLLEYSLVSSQPINACSPSDGVCNTYRDFFVSNSDTGSLLAEVRKIT